jgi:NarL family two-component system response regulator LiaR
MGKISIMLVEDHDVVREGLRALLLAQQDIEVIGEARDGREAVDLARRTEPQVVGDVLYHPGIVWFGRI